MGNSPAIFSGRRAKLLTPDGLLLSSGATLDNDGPRNYVANGKAEVSTVGWATYADAAGALPVDGTGGSPASTLTRSTTTPLRGAASFLWTKSAANRQGEGFSYDFTIDAADKAKVLQVSFDYFIASGTYASSDLTVYIYDVTNALVIQPSGYTIQNALVQMKQSATFQTASNSTSYRLIVHTASTSASAYSLQFDNFSVGPQIVTQGAAITDFIDAVPATIIGSGSGSLTIGTGGGAIYSVKTRRVGANLELRYEVRIGTSGASDITTGTYIFPYPSGITTALNSYSVIGFGDITAVASATPTNRVVAKVYASGFILDSADSGLLAASGNLFNNANTLSVLISIPVTGQSSNLQLSSDTDTRVVAARYSLSSTTAFNSAIVKYDTKTSDTHSAYNTSTGVYTIPVPGTYFVSTKAFSASTVIADLQIRKNSSGISRSSDLTAGNDFYVNINTIVECKAGDTIDVFSGGTSTYYGSPIDNEMNIFRLSGPSTIAASETVACKYGSHVAQSLTGSYTPNVVKYLNKVIDTHSAYSPASGLYSVPVSGLYETTGVFILDGSVSASTDYYGEVYVNGVSQATMRHPFGTPVTIGYAIFVTTIVRVNAGDTISVSELHGAATTYNLTATGNATGFIIVKRIGN